MQTSKWDLCLEGLRVLARIFRATVFVATTLLFLGCENEQELESSVNDDSVEAIHKRIMTLDTHVDIHIDMALDPRFDPGTLTEQQVDLPKMDEGGLDAVFYSVYVGQTRRTEEGYAEAKRVARRRFDAIHWMTAKYSDRISLAETPQDARDIYASGRKVAMIGIENAHAIGDDLSLIEEYYRRGARYMSLTHNGHNDLCDSAQPDPDLGDLDQEHGGLTDFGKRVIGEMNRVGMMVDVSHTSVNCMMQATAYSKVAPIASHSAVYALAEHVRNLTDEQMIALADAGGVMQVVAYNQFIKFDPSYKESQAVALRKVAEAHSVEEFVYEKHYGTPAFKEIYGAHLAKFPRATVKDYVDHIDYAVELIGIDHVGIVSDFDGGGGIDGWNDATETMNVTRELLARGYSENEIEKLWSGNTLALWESVNESAAEIINR